MAALREQPASIANHLHHAFRNMRMTTEQRHVLAEAVMVLMAIERNPISHDRELGRRLAIIRAYTDISTDMEMYQLRDVLDRIRRVADHASG